MKLSVNQDNKYIHNPQKLFPHTFVILNPLSPTPSQLWVCLPLVCVSVSQPDDFFLPADVWKCLGDIFDLHLQDGLAAAISWVEVRDAAK